MFEWLVFSDPKLDAHRFADAVRGAVAEGRARDYKRFRTWAAGVDARPRPRAPLAPRGSGARKGKKGGGGDEQALVAQIRRGTTNSAKRFVLGARAKAAIAGQGLLHSSAWWEAGMEAQELCFAMLGQQPYQAGRGHAGRAPMR